MKNTILLVDDMPENLKVLSGILKNEGFIIRYAKSGEQALQSIELSPPCLILMDVMMPGMSGYEACEIIKKTPSLKEIPIIFLSALSGVDDKMKAFEVGGVDFIEKPFHSAEVLARVRMHIELYRSKRELVEVAARMKNAERLASMGSWEWDVADNKVIWSEELYNVFGETEESYTPTFEGYLAKIHENDRMRIAGEITKALENRSTFEFEETIEKPNGEERILSSFGEVLVDNSGNPVKMVGVCVDITSLKEADRIRVQFTEDLERKVKQRTEELEKAQKRLKSALAKEKELSELKSHFVSVASHQFRTPLTVIKSDIGLLGMQLDKIDSPLKEKFDVIANRMNSQISRMTEMMNEVLILGKIGVGGIKPSFAMYDMVTACDIILKNYDKIQKDGRKGILEVKGTPREVSMDKKLFEHAFSNIVSNAFKYSPENPPPKVVIDYAPKKTILKIIDFGIGIPKDEIEHIFEPFYRGANAAGISGSGLGTSIIKEFMEMNKGSVLVESELNKGTTFTIEFNQ